MKNPLSRIVMGAHCRFGEIVSLEKRPTVKRYYYQPLLERHLLFLSHYFSSM